MSVNLSKEDANIGQIIYQWKVKEYETPERDRRWFIVMTIFAAILLIYGFWTSNHLFCASNSAVCFNNIFTSPSRAIRC